MGALEDFWWLFLDIRCILLWAFLLLLLGWFFLRTENLPPGPWGLPLIGSIPALIWEVGRGVELEEVLRRYAVKYGPVFHLKILNKTLVVLNDYTSVKEAFQHPQLNDRTNMQIYVEGVKGEGIIASSGQVWMQSRRFCMNILRSFGVGKSSFEERIGREAEELIKEMSAFDGKPLDPKSLLMNAVANVICSVMFGKRYEYTDAEFRRLLYCISRNAELFGAGGVILFFPSLRHLPFFSTAELKANFDLLLEFLNDAVDAHRAALDANNPKDLIDMCLLEIKQHETQNQSPSVAPSGDLPNSSAYIKEENLHSIISDIFLAGSETTATTLQWLLLYVAVYPKIQQRVQAEIDAVVGRDRLPRMADKLELNFTQAVIWEVQRLCPVVPLGVAHAAASDTQFHGYTVPKETVLVSNLLMVFQDPKVWREPQKFDPGRFLNEEGKAIKADELIPFSVGKRSCIGDNLAKMELFIFFSYFMHQFTVRKPDDSPPLSLKGNVGLINPPVPFQICICKRE